MATVNVTDYGAVPNDETHDCGPDFASAIAACKVQDTLYLPAGVWHVISYPTIHGAFPAVQADVHAFIEFHLDTDYYGTPTPEALQKFLAWHEGLPTEYGWRMLGLGVRS